jgi:hypothetical protein
VLQKRSFEREVIHVASRTYRIDYGRVILYFLCYYFRKVQAVYSEEEYNPLMMRFKEQCNLVIENSAPSFQLKLAQLILDFYPEGSGFRLQMRFEETAQALAFWEIMAAFLRFSPMDLADTFEEDTEGAMFPFLLLANQCKFTMKGRLILLDLPAYPAFLTEFTRWNYVPATPAMQSKTEA